MIMSKELDYYEILGVSPDAEDVVIRGARQALRPRTHCSSGDA
jgi:curved DNA-binding protein CbpA